MKTNLVQQAISLGLSLINNAEGIFISAYKNQLGLLLSLMAVDDETSFDEDADGNMIYVYKIA